MPLQKLLQRRGSKGLVVGNHLNQSRQVRKEISLVSVGEHSRHGGVVKLDLLVVDLDKVNVGVGLDQGQQC